MGGEEGGGRGEGGWGGGGPPTADSSALPTAISPNWSTCTLNVQKFGFANLAHYDFFKIEFWLLSLQNMLFSAVDLPC